MKSLAWGTKVLGTVVCIGGSVLLTLYKGKLLTNTHLKAANNNTTSHTNMIFPSTNTERWTVGSIFFIAGYVAWFSWSLVQTRIGKRFPCQYSSTAIIYFFGVIRAILSLIIERNLLGWI